MKGLLQGNLKSLESPENFLGGVRCGTPRAGLAMGGMVAAGLIGGSAAGNSPGDCSCGGVVPLVD